MLRITLKWNVDDVGNALTCACCVCSWRGCIDLVGCPWWGKIEWLKNLSISKGMLRRFIHGKYIDGAHEPYFILHGNSINFFSKYL